MTQQVKEHVKNPLNQRKEEEIRSLPLKEFRIMIVKMIKNLENKMELQINRLETRIEKMQEMFNKHLWQPTPVLLPGKYHGQRSLVGCSPWGCKESDTTERLTHLHGSS